MSAAAKLETAAADPFATVRALNRMRAAGFALSVRADKLVVAPAESLTDDQRAYIRSHKAALVGLLSDAETIATALSIAGANGIAWREGTPADWPDDRLLAAGEVLYADGRMVSRKLKNFLNFRHSYGAGRMVSRLGRRYGPTSAPAIEIGPEYPPGCENA